MREEIKNNLIDEYATKLNNAIQDIGRLILKIPPRLKNEAFCKDFLDDVEKNLDSLHNSIEKYYPDEDA